MVVVQINAVYGYGSTGRNTQELHEYFLNAGIESYVFCRNSHVFDEKILQVGNSADWKLHALQSRIWGRQAFFSKRATRKLISELQRIAADVVILGNLHSNYINLPLLLKYLARENIRVICVLHDCWFFTGHCCHYTEDKCDEWQKKCGKCKALNKYNTSLLFDKTSQNLKDKKALFGFIKDLTVVGVSDWITEEAKKSILGNARRIIRIYNWVDLEIFKPMEVNEIRVRMNLNSQFVVLGIAQIWSEAKGLRLFLQLAEEMPEIRFVLVGSIVQEVVLLPNMIAVGTIGDMEQLAQYYSLADVMLNPSIQETFGKVTAESLACGTPVIVNDATANPELVGEGCGYVVQCENREVVKEKINEIKLNSKEFYKDKCRTFAEKMFDKNILMKEYLDLTDEE